MSTARSAIEDRIEYIVMGELAASGTATGGSATTVIDTGRPSSGEDFTHWYVHIDTDAGGASAAPEGEERVVSAYVASTRVFTVPIAFSAAVAASDTYSVRKSFGKLMIDEAINHGIEEGNARYVDIQTDETIRIKTDIYEYAIPTNAQHIYQIWLRVSDDKDSGTASVGAATTLTDSTKSWTTNEWANMEVVIYDGTGAGQYKTIISNTATVLTISSGSTDWTTNPDSTSKYRIKDITVDHDWSRIYSAQIDIAGGEIRFPGQLTEGEALRVIYHKEYAALTTDAATTSMPIPYIIGKAMAFLSLSLVGRRDRREEAAFQAERWEAKAELYAAQHKQAKPSDTMWTWPGRTPGWDTGPFAPSGQSAGYVG